MVRRNLVIFWCMEVIGGMLALVGWLFDRPIPLAVGLVICAADILFVPIRFRCPCCGRFLGIAKYECGKACPHCGTTLGGSKTA